ncbi:MAG: DUF4476 domain-containing protein [Ferruginibacter sp.]
MRFFNYLVFSFLFLSNAKAQHVHFVYIQTENKQAFYVKINEKIYSSSASGYAIISKLLTGTYKLNIGFPKNEWPSQNIDINITDKDKGFLLKNFESKGWGLFDIQTMDIIMATASAIITTPAPIQKTDAFSNTLAKVTNTPSIGQQEPKDSTAIVAGDASPPVKDETTPVSIQPTQANQVLSVLDSNGRSAIYTLNNGSGVDSIRVFIPYEKKDNANEADAAINGLAGSTINKDNITVPAINPVPSNKNEYKVTLVNPACRSTATESDFLNMRRKMAAAGKDEDMLAVAKKGFKSKCFTTDQVKNLSLLFLNDFGKYNFYDVAYEHVSDIGNFKSLQSQLTEEYYINRFKAMLR